MLDDIVGRFGDHDAGLAAFGLVKAEFVGQIRGHSSGLTDLARFGDRNRDRTRGHQVCLQRATATLVPCPGLETTSNSLHKRFAPPSPKPSPFPVVYPSCKARAM